MISYDIYPADEGILIADRAALRRSGHLGHALVEYAPGQLLSFASDTSGSRSHGHSGYGWVETRRSSDSGETWSEPTVLRCSVDAFLDGVSYIACEKAVSPRENVITACCLRYGCQPYWEPFYEPAAIISYDGGHTWGELIQISPYRGRVYDMLARDGVIYALHFCNDAEVSFTGNRPEHVYRLYESRDAGESWQEVSVLPFDANGLGYGAMEFLPDGSLLCAAYDINDEYNMPCVISRDMGRTWEKPFRVYLDKRIRNPQLVSANGVYFLHGRSGCVESDMPSEFVLYASPDCVHWDEGRYIRTADEEGWGNHGYYSDSIRVDGRVLIQYSQPYHEARTNICQTWIENIHD